MLSLTKLDKLLLSKNLIILYIFTIDHLCVFIEVLSLMNGNIFQLYVPSKYDIKADKHLFPQFADKIFKLIDIQVDEYGNVTEDYAGNPDQTELEQTYNEVEIDININPKENLEGVLEENYNRPILLQDFSKNDKKDLKDTYRQLNRLKLCTKNLKYKLGIVFKNYMACIRRDDSISCYLIKDYTGTSYHKLYIIIDLETFYGNSETLLDDINTIQDGLFKILDKNQEVHAKTFVRLVNEEEKIVGSRNINNKKAKYSLYINQLQDLLLKLHKAEKKIQDSIKTTIEKFNNETNSNLHHDIQNSYTMDKYHKDLNSIKNLQQDILQTLLSLKSQKEEIFLSTDKVLFDNNVMLNTIVKNLDQFHNI